MPRKDFRLPRQRCCTSRPAGRLGPRRREIHVAGTNRGSGGHGRRGGRRRTGRAGDRGSGRSDPAEPTEVLADPELLRDRHTQTRNGRGVGGVFDQGLASLDLVVPRLRESLESRRHLEGPQLTLDLRRLGRLEGVLGGGALDHRVAVGVGAIECPVAVVVASVEAVPRLLANRLRRALVVGAVEVAIAVVVHAIGAVLQPTRQEAATVAVLAIDPSIPIVVVGVVTVARLGNQLDHDRHRGGRGGRTLRIRAVDQSRHGDGAQHQENEEQPQLIHRRLLLNEEQTPGAPRPTHRWDTPTPGIGVEATQMRMDSTPTTEACACLSDVFFSKERYCDRNLSI